MRFRVSPEMAPGVFRAGVGFFSPGQVVELPDGASPKNDKGEPDIDLESVSLRFIPLDEESRKFLLARQAALPDVAGPAMLSPDGRMLPTVRAHEHKGLRIRAVEGAPPAKPEPERPMTIKEAAQAIGAPEKHKGRAADK